jgi:outer membrane autotransporter protein
LLAFAGCGDRALGSDGRIVRAAIHPAIGIARVGNSPDEYYFGPEIPGGLPIAPDGYKDASGAMKRQAARFRVFGLDAQGQVVRELTARDATEDKIAAETKATSTSTLDQLHNNPKPIFSFTGTGTCTGTVREEYTGTQFGFDLYKLNVANTGANFHLGITGGYFNSQAKDISVAPVSTAVDIPDGNFVADSKVPFAGVYAVYTQGGFFADTQLRFDFYKNTVSDPSNGLGGQSLNARGMSVTGNVGYNIKLPSNWFIEPSVGAVWSRVQVDRFNAPGVIAPVTDPVIFPAQQFAVFSKGFVEFEDIESLLGRATLRFGATIANGDYVWQPFASVSLLHEYAENVRARSEISGFSISLDGSGLNMSTSRVGTYAQYGIGSGLVLGDSGWLGYGRVDYKTGENIEGVNVNFGLRKQW